VLGLALSSERVVETLVGLMAAQVSPPLQVSVRPRPGNVVVEVGIDAGERASKTIFHVIRGFLRRTPNDFNLPPFDVETRMGDREARLDVRFERSSWVGRLRRRLRLPDLAGDLVAGFRDQRRDLDQAMRRMEEQTRALRESDARNRGLMEELERALDARTHELEASGAELRELQSRLVRADRLGTAQELAGSVAHAINNPLTALIGQIQMMVESAQPTRSRLRQVHHLAQRIGDVVTGTLQLYRRGELDLASEDPERVLEDVASSLRPEAERAGVEIELKCEPGLPPIEIDGAMLRAALCGLGENAIEASPRGMSVQLEVTLAASSSAVEFRIADAGRGIPPKEGARVLEPFFTTKPGGTGLGLAIAHGVAVGHRGRLQLLPRPGGGTLASVELPLAGNLSSECD
jgi:signal transduction histidine kinase